MIENAIIERAFEEGWVQPQIPRIRTGKTVAVVGSGPAGLACADQLNQAGHRVTVFEKSDRIGGLLTYGIPNMKLDKKVVLRRIELLRTEGIKFQMNCEIGVDRSSSDILEQFDAVLLAGGAGRPRELQIPGRDLDGIHPAMDYLVTCTQAVLDQEVPVINATGKDVIVIGGGDTGTDCVASALRQGCKSLTQFEILPAPAPDRTADNPWPLWPLVFRTDYGQKEAEVKFGKDPREFAVLTKKFLSNREGGLGALKTVRVEWNKNEGGQSILKEIPGSEEEFPAQLVLLAMGFLGPEDNILNDMGIEKDSRSNVKANEVDYKTNLPGVFSAGDMRRGQSLIVWAIREGREAAREIDGYLT